MRGDVFQDAGQRPDLERLMLRNDFVILPINLRGYADVGALLAGRLISQNAQSLNEASAVDVPRQFHCTRTSSRTKCSRMIFGAGMVSSK
jgi:hypothetical protein